MRTLFFLPVILLFLLPGVAYAQVAISEVMWMGSDLSTADEWVEITQVPCSDCSSSIDLSGWRLTYLNSKNEEALILRFATGTFISQGAPMVIASRSSSNSRLLAEPAIVTSSLTLPNTKLLLRLYNASGSLIDTVDDGVGTPFAGANPSGTGGKASMERIDLRLAGNTKENWKTAEISSGFDPGFSLFGTPGSLGILDEEEAVEECSDFTGEENHCDTTVIQTGSVVTESASSQVSSTGILLSQLASQENTSNIKDACKVPVDSMIRISELLPNPIGDDTLYEFIELKNYSDYSILLCGLSIDTGDNTTKFLLDDYILNPQAFISLERPRTKLTLGNEKGKVRLVSAESGSVKILDEVVYDQSQEGSSYARTDGDWWTWTKSPTLGAKNRFDTGVIASRFHSDGVILSSLLPNAPASDSTSEWIELKNTTSEYRSLIGWKFFETKLKKTISLDNFSIFPGSTLRLWSSETKLQLPNAGGEIELLNPYDTVISTIEWPEAKEGSIYKISEFSSDTISAKAAKVLDGDTFIASFDEAFERKFGFREISVRLIGIDAPEIAHDEKKAEEYSFEAKEYLRALIEGKNVELEFGSEKYDAYGRLLAYVQTDTSQIVQLLLLKSGLVHATKAFPHTKQEEFFSFENMAKEKELGVWSLKPYVLSGALRTAKILENQSLLGVSGSIINSSKNEYRNQKIVITEVYASPKAALQASLESVATLELTNEILGSLRWEGKEWVEVKNLSNTSMNLKSWILRAGTGANSRERVIEQDILILPRSYALLDISDFHLQLRNDGALLELLDPLKVTRNAVVYPKLSKGQSYSRRSPVSKNFCITESPTPLKDTRCTGKVKKRKK